MNRWVWLLLALTLWTTGCTQDAILADYLNRNQAALQQPYSDSAEVVPFRVEPGTPARQIALNLAEAGLIQDARLFEAYVRTQGIAQRLEAGDYALRPNMTPVEIAQILQNAQAASLRVTIPEGWRLEQVADVLEGQGLFPASDYRAATQTPQPFWDAYPFLRAKPLDATLEGYLFPDTYQLPAADPQAVDLVRRQLDNFQARVVPVYDAARAEGATDLDLHTVLILASIVEREAVVADERAAIAGVYLNRLAVGMRLEADPTVQYAMGYQPATGQWWKTPVSLAEYSEVNSPYNTYLYGGLPPGPIASPGLGPIQAVLAPEQHDYFYFVATADGTGSHVFARTWDEHVENVRRYYQRLGN